MKQTIKTQDSITPLDARFGKCSPEHAVMQLEIYHTANMKTIACISAPTGKFSYNIGTNVNTHVQVNNWCYLANIIPTKFLNKILLNQR